MAHTVVYKVSGSSSMTADDKLFDPHILGEVIRDLLLYVLSDWSMAGKG